MVLRVQNNFTPILPNHWPYRVNGERVRPYNVSQTLGFEKFNRRFSTGFLNQYRMIEKVTSYKNKLNLTIL